MEQSVIATQTGFPDYAALKRAVVSRAIEIPILCLQERVGIISSRRKGAVDRGECSIGCELEHHTIAGRSAEKGRAIKITVTALHKRQRVISVRAIEGSQGREGSVRGNLENCPVIPKTTPLGRSVQQAIVSANQYVRVGPVRFIEIMDRREASVGRQSEDSADSESPIFHAGSIEVAIGSLGEFALGSGAGRRYEFGQSLDSSGRGKLVNGAAVSRSAVIGRSVKIPVSAFDQGTHE